jgi:acyl dehydratase
MRVVDFIKDNQQKAKAVQTQLIDKFEPTLRNWSGTVNKKLTEAIATRSYLSFFNIHTAEQETWIQQCPELELAYKDLHKTLGEESYIGAWYTVDQACINQFATATGDEQWIHIDPERARLESPFRSTIAHGFLTLALIPLLTESVAENKKTLSQAKMVVNYGLNRVRFPSPIKEGKRIRARSRVINLVLMKRGLEVVREVTVEVENSVRPACVADTVLRLYF